MRTLLATGLVLALSIGVSAAPNVVNSAQKGSLLIFPDVDVRNTTNTLIRLQNDGTSSVDVKCYWTDGNRHRSDFAITLTRNQAAWFEAKSGRGSTNVSPFPQFASNGYDNPFLGGADANPYRAGQLVCFAVKPGEQHQIKWNHLSGTATVFDDANGGSAYEYGAYSFFISNGVDLQPQGTAGAMFLNGIDYDACPLYQIGQLAPEVTVSTIGNHQLVFWQNRLTLVGCTMDLRQDWLPQYTKWVFDVWNADEIKFSGAFECADSWHETVLTDIDSAAQNFTRPVLGTDSARYRVQGVKSTQCPLSQADGVLAIQSTNLSINGNDKRTGTNLTSAGRFIGSVLWDPEQAVPEGGFR
ncbi:MAG: hypothetical protein AB7I50_19820 [Vicinamibacterales bacterium]